jgi:hypothetical protein
MKNYRILTAVVIVSFSGFVSAGLGVANDVGTSTPTMQLKPVVVYPQVVPREPNALQQMIISSLAGALEMRGRY